MKVINFFKLLLGLLVLCMKSCPWSTRIQSWQSQGMTLKGVDSQFDWQVLTWKHDKIPGKFFKAGHTTSRTLVSLSHHLCSRNPALFSQLSLGSLFGCCLSLTLLVFDEESQSGFCRLWIQVSWCLSRHESSLVWGVNNITNKMQGKLFMMRIGQKEDAWCRELEIRDENGWCSFTKRRQTAFTREYAITRERRTIHRDHRRWHKLKSTALLSRDLCFPKS